MSNYHLSRNREPIAIGSNWAYDRNAADFCHGHNDINLQWLNDDPSLAQSLLVAMHQSKRREANFAAHNRNEANRIVVTGGKVVYHMVTGEPLDMRYCFTFDRRNGWPVVLDYDDVWQWWDDRTLPLLAGYEDRAPIAAALAHWILRQDDVEDQHACFDVVVDAWDDWHKGERDFAPFIRASSLPECKLAKGRDWIARKELR